MLEILYFLFIIYVITMSLFLYNNYDDICKVYTIVYQNKEGLLMIAYYTGLSLVKIVWKKIHISCIKNPSIMLKDKITVYLEKNGYVKHSVVLIDNKYHATLNINNKIYKFIIKKMRPPNITQIIDENDNDVTNEIEPYLLARQTIITELTPGKLNKKSLHFTDREITFLEDDIMN